MPARVTADHLTGGAPVVVLAPHPDDESLGCGGLLAYAFAHHGAHVVCLTDGAGSHTASEEWPPARLADLRQHEIVRAIECLGGGRADLTCLGHPDGWLGTQKADTIVTAIAEICRRVGAKTLFAPALEDHHEDHKAAFRIAVQTVANLPGMTLFTYPVWSRWDGPDPLPGHDGVAFDTGPFRPAKRAAIMAHASQLGQIIHDDPGGFAMSDAFVNFFVNHDEVFWKTPA